MAIHTPVLAKVFFLQKTGIATPRLPKWNGELLLFARCPPLAMLPTVFPLDYSKGNNYILQQTLQSAAIPASSKI